MPCGDWVPLDYVIAIILNKETLITKPHVNVFLNQGKINLVCPCASDAEALDISNKLGEAVNKYREIAGLL